jgi:hypothetical protein
MRFPSIGGNISEIFSVSLDGAKMRIGGFFLPVRIF